MKTLRTALFGLIALISLFLSACAPQTSVIVSKTDALGQVAPFTLTDNSTVYGIGLISADTLPEPKTMGLITDEALRRGWVLLSPEQTDELRRVLAREYSGHKDYLGITVISELLSEKGTPIPGEYALRILGSEKESGGFTSSEMVGFYRKDALATPGLRYAFIIPHPAKGRK